MILDVKIKKVIYTNSKTNFQILDVEVIKDVEWEQGEAVQDFAIRKRMKVKGVMPAPKPGDIYSLQGSLAFDNELYIKIKKIEFKEFEIVGELEKFIKENVKGVGKTIAKKLVEKYGLKTREIITAEDGREKIIEAIYKEGTRMTEKRIETVENIYTSLLKHKNSMLIMEFLQINGLPVSLVNDIAREYGTENLKQMNDNPYFFIRAVNFQDLDKIAYLKGLKKNDIRRIKASIQYFLEIETRSRGNVYSDIDRMYEEIVNIINDKSPFEFQAVPAHMAVEALNELIYEKQIVLSNDKYLYKNYLYNKERGIARNVERLSVKEDVDMDAVEALILMFESEKGLRLSEEQREGVKMAMSNGFSILTGLPGAGKTLVVSAIIYVYERLFPNNTIAPLAPTGKASKRMSQVSGVEARTIHRALKVQAGMEERAQILEQDFVIIDEVSMLDIYLAETLMSNIKTGSKLLFVGDVEQLPSVGAGLVLRDLIDSEKVPVVKLTQFFRQAKDSTIVTNAHAIANRNYKFDFKEETILWNTEVKNLEKNVIASYDRLMKPPYNFKRDEIAILTPQREKTAGTINLNRLIQQHFNKDKKEIVINEGGDKFRVDDIVIHTENNSDLDVYNGEVGRIVDIMGNKEEFVVLVKYPDKENLIEYKQKDIKQLDLAYALTIHKSQGSEYKAVINVCSVCHSHMLDRNLIYTAWTRAKEKLIIVGDETAINEGVRKSKTFERNSNLVKRLNGETFYKNEEVKVKNRVLTSQEVEAFNAVQQIF